MGPDSDLTWEWDWMVTSTTRSLVSWFSSDSTTRTLGFSSLLVTSSADIDTMATGRLKKKFITNREIKTLMTCSQKEQPTRTDCFLEIQERIENIQSDFLGNKWHTVSLSKHWVLPLIILTIIFLEGFKCMLKIKAGKPESYYSCLRRYEPTLE